MITAKMLRERLDKFSKIAESPEEKAAHIVEVMWGRCVPQLIIMRDNSVEYKWCSESKVVEILYNNGFYVEEEQSDEIWESNYFIVGMI